MDQYQRQRSHTISEDIHGLNIESNKHFNYVSKEINTNNRISLPAGSTSSLNTSTGKSRMKLFSSHHNKQTSSNNSSEHDLSYITPRLIVMTTPKDDSFDISSRSTVELIHNVLNTKHPNSYIIYTLDQYANEQLLNRKELFNNRVIDLPLFNANQTPRLVVLLWFCQKITSYLLESPSNIVVLHSIEEINQLAFGACSLLAYHQIFSKVDQIIQYYQSKRSSQLFLTMSQKRYIQYLCDLSFDSIERPHFNQVYLKSIHLSPVPLVNKQKTGCRPFVDIYDQDQNKIYSTYQETAKLRVYSSSDSSCIIPINLSFNGDLTIHITHATIGHSRQTHEGGIRICELTINSNFSTINHSEIFYQRNELDEIDQNEKNPTLFRVIIDITHSEKSFSNEKDGFTELLEKTFKQPFTLFGDEYELHKTTNGYETQFENEVLTSVVHRPRKSKDELTSTSPRSSQKNIRYSLTSPFSSFINPRHSLSKQKNEILIEQNSNHDQQINVGNLLDFDDEEINNHSNFQTSLSSNKQQQFHSNLQTQTNLLDDDFNLISQTNLTQIILPSPVSPTILPKVEEQKSLNSTEQTNTTQITNTPNYNVNLVTNNNSSSQSNSTQSNSSQKPKINIDQYFTEIGIVKKDSKSNSEPPIPTTIGAARQALRAKDIDPTVLKVREWTEGKKRNLRALLCSLSKVTWPECTWTGCQMNELVTDEQVKKVYRKAVLHIHPDKLRGDPNEALAKLIFVELNEAWSQFVQESNK